MAEEHESVVTLHPALLARYEEMVGRLQQSMAEGTAAGSQLGKLPCCERFPWVSGPNQSLRAHHPHQEVQGHKNTHQGFWHDR